MTPLPNTEFDYFSSHYEEYLEDPVKSWFAGNSSSYYLQLKAVELCQQLRRLGLQPQTLKVLEVGCGTGTVIRMLEPEFLELSGVDSSKGMIDTARKRSHNRTNFEVSEQDRLPFTDQRFDIVYSMSLYHHVPAHARLTVLAEMHRVLKNGGWLINFEHNPLNPMTRWIVKRCPVDRGVTLLRAAELISLCQQLRLRDLQTRFILFFPRTLGLFRRLEPSLFWCPLGGQFYVSARKQPL